jgi:tartrate dehydratase alpha subunit/fumarate hydratase class I-like protein
MCQEVLKIFKKETKMKREKNCKAELSAKWHSSAVPHHNTSVDLRLWMKGGGVEYVVRRYKWKGTTLQ